MNTFSPNVGSHSLPVPFDKFQPLLDFLAAKGKPQVIIYSYPFVSYTIIIRWSLAN